MLHSFIKMGVSDGLGSRKVEVLADTAVTLEQGGEGVVASEVIKKLLSVSVEREGGRGGIEGGKERGEGGKLSLTLNLLICRLLLTLVTE